MAQTIKNLNQLTKALEPKIMAILESVAKDVRKEIDDAINRYYSEYDPTVRQLYTQLYYHRTEQLKNCCKISNIKNNGNSMGVEVYLDINSLKYDTSGADAYKTVRAADSSLHGGFDIETMRQIPWSIISNNSGTSYGSGTQIWSEPMEELIDNGKLIESFKRHARQHGLNIK